MKSLLYVSRSRLEPEEVEIEVQRIVATARSHNGPAGITGALVFTHSHFAQYLEGAEDAINELMERLRQDRRHEDLRIVRSVPFLHRYFAGWSMAYCGSSVYISRIAKNVFENEVDNPDTDRLLRLMREMTNEVNPVR